MADAGVVVIDLGSANIKAGLATGFPNEAEPRVVTPSCVRVASASPDAPPAQLRAVEAGVVRNWEALEAVLHHVLYRQLGWAPGEEAGLLLAEPTLAPRLERERLAQLAFEAFNVPGYFAVDQAVASLHAVGRGSGLVVDLGRDKTDVTPVVDGVARASTARRLPYGGRHLGAYLQQLLASRGGAAGSGSSGGAVELSAEAAEALAAACARVADSKDAAAEGVAAAQPTQHALPDGQTVALHGEGLQLGEALLDPGVLGLALPPLAAAVHTAAAALPDRDSRRAVYEAVLPCGGGSGAPGLGPRLLREARALSGSALQPQLCSIPEYMPPHTARCAAWMGGALAAKVVWANSQQVTKQDYEEWGPGVVHRKCC